MNRRPTVTRGYAFPDHRPPSGKHAGGREQAHAWKGTARTVDRPSKKRANALSWRKELAKARREHVTRLRALAAIVEAEAAA